MLVLDLFLCNLREIITEKFEDPNPPLNIRTQFCRLHWVKARIEWSEQKKRKREEK